MKRSLMLVLAGVFAAFGAEPQPEAAIPAIVSAFDKHSIVALAESRHAVEQFHAFYRSLLTSPEFLEKVNDVVIEFGNSLYQPILDRYILQGEEIAFATLAPIWRSCPHNFAWEGPAYPEFLKAVHDKNKTLRPGRRLRLLAGDAPIDWAKVHTHKQYERFDADRDPSFSRVIDKQVLRKGRKALVIMGMNHLTKSGDRNGDDDTTTLVEHKHPGSVYVVMVLSKDYPEAAGWKGPSFLPIAGAWLSRLPQKLDADAAVYIGPSSSFTMTFSRIQWDTYDAAYLNEIDRRHRIIHGCTFDLEARRIGPDPYKGWPCHR